MEDQTIRRVAWRIVPFLVLLYMVSFIDRVNIGFASLEMDHDLRLTPAVFGFGAGIFFVGYFLFEIPSNLILHRVGARLWIARVMITWGLVSGATAFVTGEASFYVLRFLLGIAEAGFFPGVILYLSYWFPQHRRAAMTALFTAATPLSAIVGSPLSAALLHMRGILGLAGWQWMFLLEALPAIALGVAVLFYLTERPERAAWLATDQRDWLVATMAAEQAAKAATAKPGVLSGLGDIRVLALALVYLGTSAGLYTLGIWTPQIIRTLGLGTMAVGFLSAVPAGFAVVGMVWWARHSDRTGERTWHVVGACLLACVGLVFAGVATSLPAVLFALTLVNVGVNASKPPLWSLPTQFLSGAGAAAGIATINAIGNLGGFIGPWAIGWFRGATGSFAGGLDVVAALLLLSAVITLLLARSGPRLVH